MDDHDTGAETTVDTGTVAGPLPPDQVTIADDFWAPRRETNRSETLRNQLEKLDGRIANLERAAGRREGDFEGPYHNDPPVYKWIEAAADVLATEDDPELAAEVDRVIDVIEAAQLEDGYLHSNFIVDEQFDLAERWTNLGTKHELFAAGHLIEAAVAHHEATGDRRLLAVALDFADHLCETFGPDGHTGYPGHPEVEMALVRLYRHTGTERYLDLARFFVDERGREDSRFKWEVNNVDEVAGWHNKARYLDEDNEGYTGHHAQDHRPVREQEAAVGHAVRALFLYCGMTDVAAETDDEELLDAVRRLWDDVARTKTYVTGGIGATSTGEAFGDSYDLPNADAYAETCAAFGNVIWNQRLFRLSGDATYVDTLERTLYNGFLAGVSLDGTQFCYTNPLANDEGHHRQEWYHTSCCPPNAARLLASLERYVYAVGDGDLYVNLFVAGSAETEFDGTPVTVRQATDYPWDGRVEVTVDPDEPTDFALRLRVPDWAREATVSVDGERVDPVREAGYAVLDRTWEPGETVTLDLSTPVERVEAHPEVDDARGRVALQRGPVVYCVEETDVAADPARLVLPADETPSPTERPDLLDGVVTLDGEALVPDAEAWDGDLYRDADAVDHERTDLVAVPYYGWDHREPGAMRVWLPTTERDDPAA